MRSRRARRLSVPAQQRIWQRAAACTEQSLHSDGLSTLRPSLMCVSWDWKLAVTGLWSKASGWRRASSKHGAEPEGEDGVLTTSSKAPTRSLCRKPLGAKQRLNKLTSGSGLRLPGGTRGLKTAVCKHTWPGLFGTSESPVRWESSCA